MRNANAVGSEYIVPTDNDQAKVLETSSSFLSKVSKIFARKPQFIELTVREFLEMQRQNAILENKLAARNQEVIELTKKVSSLNDKLTNSETLRKKENKLLRICILAVSILLGFPIAFLVCYPFWVTYWNLIAPAQGLAQVFFIGLMTVIGMFRAIFKDF